MTPFAPKPKIVREYFAFGEMIAEYERICKDDPSQLPTLIAACEGQVALADAHAKHWKREFRGSLPPKCPGYERLVLALESLGRFEDALLVAKRAYRKQWEGQHQWPPESPGSRRRSRRTTPRRSERTEA